MKRRSFLQVLLVAVAAFFSAGAISVANAVALASPRRFLRKHRRHRRRHRRKKNKKTKGKSKKTKK